MSDSRKPNDPSNVTPNESSIWDDARITAYVMGELSAEETSVFEQAISDDPELSAAVDQARQVTDELQSLYAGESHGTLDHNRRDQILAASVQSSANVASAQLASTNSMRRFVPWLLAAAAVLLVAIGVIPKTQQAMISQYAGDVPQSFDSRHPGVLSSEPQSAATTTMDVDLDAVASLGDDVIDDGLVMNSDAAAPDIEMEESFAIHDKRLKRNVALDHPFPAPSPVDESSMGLKSDVGAASDPQPMLAKNEMAADGEPGLPTFGLHPLPPDQGLRQAGQKQTTAELGVERSRSLSKLSVVGEAISGSTVSGSTVSGSTVSGTTVQLPDFGFQPLSDRGELPMRELDRQPQDGDRFDPIIENEFKQVSEHPLSTFSVDVDTASYSKVRRSLVEGRLPRPDAVRIEELVNYFDYNYSAPDKESEHPFATDVTITRCPWNPSHRLARVAVQGKKLDRQSRPPCNLVFLLDTSGSMNQPNKLPLVVEGMKMLTGQLGKEDRVAIVVYAGSAGLILESTPANKQKKIVKALSGLSANGSTAGGQGIRLAYATARDHFIKDGVNRVILCTDGDFNVGMVGTDELVRLIQQESSDGIFLTALGFGMGNHNDAMMEQISGKGNGNYAFIDTANEACKVLVRQTNATLVTIAKDVKLQIEFNPRVYSQYRLIGYENRVMAKEDFNDDKKDAGEIGAGHQVTAFYELVPADGRDETDSAVDPLKYQTSRELTEAASGGEALTVKLRYKQPDGDASTLVQLNVNDSQVAFDESDTDFQFAASVASFGMLLRQSEFVGDWTLENVHQVANANLGGDEYQLRHEFVQLVRKAQLIRGE